MAQVTKLNKTNEQIKTSGEIKGFDIASIIFRYNMLTVHRFPLPSVIAKKALFRMLSSNHNKKQKLLYVT